jgi:hypothetical protein
MSGIGFMVAVGEAVGVVCEGIERDDAAAFRYRDSDLRYAVERALFGRLANNESLKRAYSAGSGTVDVTTGLEAAVARSVASSAEVRVGPQRSRARIAAGDAVARVRKPAPIELPPERGGVWFLVDHAKFLRFIAPLARHGCGVISLDPATTAELEASRALPVVSLDGVQGGSPPARRELGHAVADMPEVAFQFDRFSRALEQVGPQRVVVIEGNAPTDEVLNQAAKAAGMPCACLQQGWSPIVHPGFRNMSYEAMSIWGAGFRDVLTPYNPSQQFVVTGSHMLEQTRAGSGLTAQLGGRPAVGFFLQGTSPVIEPAHLDALNRLALRTADELPGVAVVVREHPGAPLPARDRDELALRENVVFAPPSTAGLRDVLDAVSVAVSIYSTTLVEAAALGVIPLIFAVTSLERYLPDLAAIGAGVEVRSEEAAFAELRRLVTDADARREFEPGMGSIRDDYFAGLDGHATERVARVAFGS